MQSLIHHALEASAARFPQKAALVMNELRTSYAALNAEANQIAHGLLAAGICKGEPVAFLGANSAEFLAAHYGISKAGAVFVPLNSHSPVPELGLILEDARPCALIVGKSHLEQAAGLADHIREMKLCVAAGALAGAASYAAWIAAQSDSNPDIAIDPQDDYLMLYTGGTTGRHKAAVSTHAARVATAIESALDYQVTHDDVGIHATQFFHMGTLNLGLQTKIMMGCTVVGFERFSAESYLEAIDRHGITYLSGVPTLFSRVLSHPDASRYHFRSLRKALYGASVMPEAVLRRALEVWPDMQFFQGYGSTEAGQATVLRPADHANARRQRTGAPMLMVDLRVVDADMRDVPPGTTGELLIRSAQLMRCYNGNPELTAQVLVGGWYHTRDAAWLDDEGYMTIAGRVDDMIVTGGENVFPQEVENILLQHCVVADTLVFGVPDTEWGNAVCAAVVVKPGERGDEQQLIDFCRTRMASYKKPKRILFVSEIPKTVVGKPDRKALMSSFAYAKR